MLTRLIVISMYLPCIAAVYRYGDVSLGAAFPCRCTGDCDPDTGNCLWGECQEGLPPGNRWRGDGCRIGNIAIGKEAYQYATYLGYPAGLAVDGHIGPALDSGYCSFTGSPHYSTPAWWYVDLGSKHIIYSVTVYNVQGYSHDYMSNFGIHVGYSSTVSSNPVCAGYESTVPDRGSVSLTCTTPMYGKYVGYRSRKPRHDADARYATICEFVVIGRSVVDCTRCPVATACDDNNGCSQCSGKKLPDCIKDCSAGRYGINCADACSSNCQDPLNCDKVNGACLIGCQSVTNYTTGAWWFGILCDIHVPYLPPSSKTSLTYEEVAENSVTIKWMHTSNLPESAFPYYRFEVYTRPYGISWIRPGQMDYDTSFQHRYELNDLVADTEYEITVIITRIYPHGQDYGPVPGADGTTILLVTTLSTVSDALSPSTDNVTPPQSYKAITSDNNGPNVNVGAIAVGAVGCALVVCVVAVLLSLFLRRQKRNEKTNSKGNTKKEDTNDEPGTTVSENQIVADIVNDLEQRGAAAGADPYESVSSDQYENSESQTRANNMNETEQGGTTTYDSIPSDQYENSERQTEGNHINETEQGGTTTHESIPSDQYENYENEVVGDVVHDRDGSETNPYESISTNEYENYDNNHYAAITTST